MDLDDGSDLPAADRGIGEAIDVGAELAPAAEGQFVRHEAVEAAGDILVALAVVGGVVVGILEKEVIVAGLGESGVGVAVLCEEAGGVAHALGPGVVALELKPVAEVLLEACLQRVVVGEAVGLGKASLTNLPLQGGVEVGAGVDDAAGQQNLLVDQRDGHQMVGLLPDVADLEG